MKIAIETPWRRRYSAAASTLPPGPNARSWIASRRGVTPSWVARHASREDQRQRDQQAPAPQRRPRAPRAQAPAPAPYQWRTSSTGPTRVPGDLGRGQHAECEPRDHEREERPRPDPAAQREPAGRCAAPTLRPRLTPGPASARKIWTRRGRVACARKCTAPAKKPQAPATRVRRVNCSSRARGG